MNFCGADCEKCLFRAPCACGGCGTPFYGTCPVADCVKQKNLEYCGLCRSFPCEMLTSCAHDPFTGDGGRRIENCEKRRNEK